MKYLNLIKSISVVAIGMSTAVIAQEKDDCEVKDKKDECIEKIVVTGVLGQIRGGIAAKEDAIGVADFISADEFGKQPDLNLADSLRRLPGVSTIFDEDEGRYVSVRGLPSRYTTVSINGAIIPNGDDAMGRQQNIESIPSFALKRTGVYKSLTSDLDGNAIGGYIENTLVSAFDADKFKMISDLRLGHHSYTDTPGGPSNPSTKAQFILSDVVGDEGEWGYVLSASWFEKKRDQSKSNRTIPFRGVLESSSIRDTPYLFNAEAIDYTNTITRWNGLARLEYRGDNLSAALSMAEFDYKIDETRYRQRVQGRGDVSGNQLGYEYPINGKTRPTLDEGYYTKGHIESAIDHFNGHTNTKFVMLELDYEFDNGSILAANITTSKGGEDKDSPANSIVFRSEIKDGLGYSYDLTQENLSAAKLTPFVLNDPSLLLDLSDSVVYQDFNSEDSTQEQAIDQLKLDYSFDADEWDFKTGLSVRHFDAFRDINRRDYYVPVDHDSVTADLFQGNNIYNPSWGYTYAALDYDKWVDFVANNPDSFVNNTEKGAHESLKQDVNYQEDITAAYVMGSYLGYNYKVTTGLRYESTDFEAQGRDESNNNALVIRKEKYSDLLPSLIASYQIKEGLKLRAGFNKSIFRPKPKDLARTEITVVEGTSTRVSKGNENLQPIKANNYDLALDYTIGKGEFVSLAYFYKDLKNEIYTLNDISFSEDEEGNELKLTITQPVNVADVKVQGIELTLVNDRFDSLVDYGLLRYVGFTSNFTWLDTEFAASQSTEPGDTRDVEILPGSQKFKMNASLIYKHKNIESKLTFAHHGRRASTITTKPYDDKFTQPYSQIDFSFRYKINKYFKVFVEGRNLTDEIRVTSYGNGFGGSSDHDGFGRDTNHFGKSYWLGMTYRL